MSDRAHEYLASHTLDSEFVKSELGWNWDDDKITIPVYDITGKLLYSKIRHLDFEDKKLAGDFSANKFSFEPVGSHPSLYCINKIKEQSKFILCEGEPDCAKLWQEHIPAVTPTAGVRNLKEEYVECLKGRTVFVALDTDKAGLNKVKDDYQLLEKIGAIPLILDLPSDVKDICEYFASGKTVLDFRQLMDISLNLIEWQDKHESIDFAIETSQERLDDPLDGEEWLIERILPVDGFCFIAGAEATGKSFYALTIADSVTSGKPWLDQFKVNKQVNVLYIDKENTKRRIQKRLRGLNITDNEFKIWWLKYPQNLELIDEKGKYSDFALSISRRVKSKNIGLIIVDSFTDLIIGNENDRKDVQAFFDAFRQLFPSCAFLVLHHASKPVQGISRTSSQKFRGSTNITAQICSGFLAQNIRKVPNEFILEQTKSGDAEKLKKFKVGLVVEPDPQDVNGTIITKIEYLGEVMEDVTKLDEVEQIVNDMFADKKIVSRKDIDNHCRSSGISVRTVSEAIKQMIDRGELLEFADLNDKRKKNYSLPDSSEQETLI